MLPPTLKRIIVAGALLVGVTAIVLVAIRYGGILRPVIRDPQRLVTLVKSWGAWAWLGMIGLQVAQVVIAPLPGNLVAMVGGYVFGLGVGFLLCRVGVVLGSIAAFLLGRLFGRRLLRVFVPEETMNRFDFFVVRHGPFYLLLLMLLPNPTGDWLYYLAGITALPLPVFCLLTLVGRSPSNFVESYLGAQMYRLGSEGRHMTWWLWALIIGGFAIVSLAYYLNRPRIERFFARFTKF
jgi:uncharacterized membrane protein YdjX (TVP38/TMEM64 family)